MRSRSLIFAAAAAAIAMALAGCSAPAATIPAPDASSADPIDDERIAGINRIVDQVVDEHSLKSAIVRVLVDGEELTTVVRGESTTGVPATAEMQFRNGSVAISYVSAILLQLVDDGTVHLDDTIDTWLPDLPMADQVTLRMLAQMTSGYPDHVANADFVDALVADPFQNWSQDELIAFSLASDHVFEPGSNWDYSHAGYVILGQVLAKATGKSLAALMDELILVPLGLENTHSEQTPYIPEPVLHAFTAERGIWEDSTFWNPSWTLPAGAVQTTDIADMASSFDAIVGAGELLSEESHKEMIAPALIGFGAPLEGCFTCHELTREWNYGLGVVRSNEWLMQTPSFGGYAGAVMTLPDKRITIAAVVTYTEPSNADWQDALPNRAENIARLIAASMSPDSQPAPFPEAPHSQ